MQINLEDFDVSEEKWDLTGDGSPLSLIFVIRQKKNNERVIPLAAWGETLDEAKCRMEDLLNK